jgi:hypothetical protein
LSEEQKILAAGGVLIDYALAVWKRLCRHDKVPKTWNALKTILREYFVPEYYANHLLAKLQSLKQGSNTVETYYLDLQILMLQCGLIECEDAIENRFLRGLNKEIYDILVHETYTSLTQLLKLACTAENEILLALHTCNEEVLSAEEIPFVPVYGFNNLQEIGPISNSGDELPCASMDNQEDKLLLPSFPKEAHIGNVWSVSDTRGECHQDQTQLSTYHATREHQIVEIIADLPLLHGDLFVDPCDKEELCDHTSLKSTTQLVHGHVQSDLNDEHVAFPHVRCVNNENEELKLISCLNTLGYIEFDILCNLDCLEKKLFQNCISPCFDHCSFYGIGKYNTRGEYMVRRVYIYLDLKPPLRVPQSDQQMTCIETTYTISSFFAIDNMLQVNFQEGEQILLPCILLEVSGLYLKELEKTPLLNNTRNAKPRTVCSQEGENDEDITSMDTTILVPSCPKVNQLHIKIKFDTFEQLMLHDDFCAFSFSELLDWIKPCVEITWKIWRTKEIDWGPSPSLPNVLHQATTSLLVQGKEESKSNTFWILDSDWRTEPSCNGCHDFIRTPIGEFLDFTESL